MLGFLNSSNLIFFVSNTKVLFDHWQDNAFAAFLVLLCLYNTGNTHILTHWNFVNTWKPCLTQFSTQTIASLFSTQPFNKPFWGRERGGMDSMEYSIRSNDCWLSQKGETPLHYAAQLCKSKVKGNADIDIVKLLLEHGADCTAVTHQVGTNWCLRRNRVKLTSIILELYLHLRNWNQCESIQVSLLRAFKISVSASRSFNKNFFFFL